MQGRIKITKSDLIEKKARDVVTMYYKKIDGVAVLIIHGIEMLILDAPKGKNKQEIDFVIVNYTKQYVLNIEVKRSLLEETQIQNKGKSVIDKAKEQSQKIKSILEDWYPHLKGVWRYGSMLYCEELDPVLRSCGHCVDFVTEGPEDLLEKLTKFDEKMPPVTAKKFPEDLKTFVKFSLFCAPMLPLPVRGMMVTVVEKAIQEAGSLENIKVWAIPTREQRCIFASRKLILLGPWGCGKTLFMTGEAIKIANGGEKVLFLIFNVGDIATKKSLLAMDLEEKFKDYPNIKVQTVYFQDGLDNKLAELGEGFKHIMVDEMFGDIDKLSKTSQDEIFSFFSSKVTVWVAMSNTFYYSSIDASVDLESWAKRMYPEDFKVARMDTTLRMPAALANEIKDGYSGMGQATQLHLNSKLMADCKVPTNLVEGCPIESIHADALQSLSQLFEQAFEKIPKGSYAVIAIDDHPYHPINQCISSMIKCKCKEIIIVMTIKLAMLRAGRKCPGFHCSSYSSPDEMLKKLNSADRDRDLVVFHTYLNGFEHPLIIDITGYYTVWSRSSSKLVKIFPNFVLDMLFVYEKMLKNDHNCDQMMSLPEEQLPQNTPSSLSTMIGKTLFIFSHTFWQSNLFVHFYFQMRN